MLDKRNAIVVSDEVLEAIQKAKGFAISRIGKNISNDTILKIILASLTQEGLEGIIEKALARTKAKLEAEAK